MKNQILLFYLLLQSISCVAQVKPKTYTDLYDLHFTMNAPSIEYPWLENAAYGNYTIPFFTQDSNSRLFMKRYPKQFPFADRLRTEYEQRILLPVHTEKEGSVEFEGKGENLSAVTIRLIGRNHEEKIIFSDSLTFTLTSSLSKVSQKIPLSSIELLDVQIHAEGKVREEAYIAFSKLSITIGNKSIDEYPVREILPLALSEKIDFVPLYPEIEKGYEKIESVRYKKVIGLGESVHKDVSVKHVAYRLIMETIRKQHCKLVLLEMPLEKTLMYNRYVMGHHNTPSSFQLLDEQTINFLDTLRIYNSNQKNEEDKVRLLGMDYNNLFNSSQNSAIDIFDFITPLNQDLKIREIDQLSVLLTEKKWDNAIHFIEEHKNKIQSLLTTDEIECILHILSLSQKMGTDGVQRSMHRDSVMFVNADFLIGKFAASSDAKVVLYAHCAHINPFSTYPAVPCNPMGMYMKNKYPDNYSPLALLVGDGNVIAYDSDYNQIEKSLKTSPTGSMEYFLKTLKKEVLYLPLTSRFNRIVLSRFKGSHHIAQEFFPMNLYQRYEGVFFINHSLYKNKIEKKPLSLDEASQEFITKNKQRKQLLEDIKKRINN